MSPSPGDLFTQYGKRTSMHGWSHMYQSNDYKRRTFWFMLAVLGSLATTLHIYKTLHTYFETPVNSRKLVGTIESIFPDVTICNTEMIPTVILNHEQVLHISVFQTTSPARILSHACFAGKSVFSSFASQVQHVSWRARASIQSYDWSPHHTYQRGRNFQSTQRWLANRQQFLCFRGYVGYFLTFQVGSSN